MKLLKAFWWLIRISCEFGAAIYIAVWPVIWLDKIVDISDDAELAGTFIIAGLCVFCLEVLWRRIFKKKPAAQHAAPATSVPTTPDRLAVSAVPRPTGQSTYILLDPKVAIAAKDYVMLDTETTGFSANTDRIIEIGAIKCINDVPAETFTTFVNPDMHIPSNVSRLTGITDIDVRSAPQFSEIAEELMAFIGDLPVVAHNAHFDARFLASELNWAGLDYVFKAIDTLQLSRIAFPHLANHKLKTLIHELGLTDHEQQHRALDDAEVGHQLFLRCKEAYPIRTKK